ncbi:MAG: 1-deoxy-D-xylulose-5-phosphate synthase [Pseudomonadales bacterium]
MYKSIPNERPATPLLDSINLPADLRQLDLTQLDALAEQLRHYLLYSVGQTGGHFGAGLGVIELTIALHYCLDTPEDRLIWDVGHQTYPHKILTGRREAMLSIRTPEGPAPFPSLAESPYDAFGTGHSSTSISAALGYALADKLQNRQSRTTVVIGDGAMTAGMAFEALNHVTACQADMLIVLNDNAMSISENVGGLANYFARNISAGDAEAKPPEGAAAVPGSIFRDLGLDYSGPVDGHDLPALISAIGSLTGKGPKILHVLTKKGKGYAPAEAAPVDNHALTKLEKQGQNKQISCANLFGRWLATRAETEASLVAITPAMKEGSDLTAFASAFPDRFHDVAIAEQHAVTLAAGLAAGGAKPVVAIYSTFLQRAYDQLIHDVAIQDLDVLFAVDRASLLEDGPTHSGVFDLSFTRAIPNLVVMAPADSVDLEAMLDFGFDYRGPALVRYPRGRIASKVSPPVPIRLGCSRLLREGKRVALLVFGALTETASQVAAAADYTLIDMRFIKPVDDQAVVKAAASHDLLVTLEENTVIGGAGSAVAEVLAAAGIVCPLLQLGVPDHFVTHDEPRKMQAAAGLSAEAITAAINKRLGQER